MLLTPFFAFAAFQAPANDGFVTDTAGVLTPEQDATLEKILSEYRAKTSNEIAVLIVPTLAGRPAADVAVEIGRAWGVGTKENDNGILMLIAHKDREILLATGYGIEGVVPDVVAGGIMEEDILPNFREGKYFEGIQAGIEALQRHIGGEYTAERYAKEEDFSAWGGTILFFVFIFIQWLGAILARTKSWWLGGVLGGILGLVLAFMTNWWIAIPYFVVFGLIVDYVVSESYHARGKTSWWAGGSWGPGGSGGSGGGFGGFGGGSFGGGGYRGRW
ncbi:MAG: TPM domain-containing protein [Patescibacteria group bacterium]